MRIERAPHQTFTMHAPAEASKPQSAGGPQLVAVIAPLRIDLGLGRPRWPGRILGPVPTLKDINLLCWLLFLAVLAVAFCIVVQGQRHNGQDLDRDFVGFYGMGRILNDHPVERLYDYELQQRVLREVHPLAEGKYGPIPYPPYVGLLFRPLAHMSYSAAYLFWLSISFALFIGGLAIVNARFFPDDPLRHSLIYCFALSFYPFLLGTIVNGQVSAIGFFALALALREDDLKHAFRSGLALSLLLYKPTLVVLLVPMLCFTRRLRTLLGMGIGVAALIVLATVIEGPGVWRGYTHLLLNFGSGSAGVHGPSFLRLWKYLDAVSFSSSVPGGRSWIGIAILSACGSWAAISLVNIWRKSAKDVGVDKRLLWAATLTWTLLLNVYVPIYDSTLLVLSVIATAAVIRERRAQFTVIWISIFLSSWVTETVARQTGVQIMTLLIGALGALQLAELRKKRGKNVDQELILEPTVANSAVCSPSTFPAKTAP